MTIPQRFHSFLKVFSYKPKQWSVYPAGLEVHRGLKKFRIQSGEYTFQKLAQIKHNDHPLFDFVRQTTVDELEWFLKQQEVKALSLGTHLKKNEAVFHYLLYRCINELRGPGEEKIELLINWYGKDAIFSLHSKHNPFLSHGNVAVKTNLKSLVFLMENYGRAINLQEQFGEKSTTFIEHLMHESSSAGFRDSILGGKWDIVAIPLGQASPHHRHMFTYKASPVFTSLKEKQAFICEKIESFQQLHADEVSTLLRALQHTGQDYLHPYKQCPEKLTPLFLLNPDLLLIRGIFNQYCEQVSVATAKSAYDSLCKSSLGFFFEKQLQSIYDYHFLDKTMVVSKVCSKARKI